MPGQGFIGSITKESGDENLVRMILDWNGTKIKFVYLALVWTLETNLSKHKRHTDANYYMKDLNNVLVRFSNH